MYQISTVHLWPGLWIKIFLFEGSGPHQKFQDPTKTLGDGRDWVLYCVQIYWNLTYFTLNL